MNLGDRPLLLALSGGADSTALLHMLASAEVPVVAAHLDHRMREESGSEVEHCARLAESLGCGFVTDSRSVPDLAARLRIGIEEAGRIARREFLQATRERQGLEWIVTAHTLDDQFETLLMRLSRGTGGRGLGGIAPVSGRFLRPFLDVPRSETHRYCADHGLAFLTDPANCDPRFARSRIRAQVVPLLADLYPGAREAAGRAARHAREDEALLDTLAAKALIECKEPDGPIAEIVTRYETRIDRALWGELPPAIRYRCLRLAVSPLTLGSAAAEAVCGDSGSVSLPGGRIVWNHSRIRCERRAEPFPRQELTEHHPACGPAWRAWIGDEVGTLSVFVRRGSVTEVGPGQEGERISPIGMTGTKKVSKALADVRIGPVARPHVPVFRGPEGPVWIPGVALSRADAVSEHEVGAIRLNLGLDA